MGRVGECPADIFEMMAMADFNPMTLSGRRILVTGASSGIGRACAQCAARLGASVILVGRRAQALEETRAVCDGNNTAASVVVGDLADAAFVRALPEMILSSGGPIDGFVHAAGNGPAIPIGVVSEKLLDESMKVNYYAFMLLMQAFSKRRFTNPGFSAVAVSSISASVGWAGGSLYSGSKGALSAAVRSLAVELAPKGMRVNAVCPGYVKTPLFDSVAGAGLSGPEGTARLLAKQPLGLGRPDQVATAVCFLLGEAASLITGVNLPVDGGFVVQ